MNPNFPPKPGGPGRDPRYAGGAYLDWKRKQKEKQGRSQTPPEPIVRPSQRAPADGFSQAEVEAARLRREWTAGRLTDAQFRDRLASLMVEDARGVWWSIGLQTGEWYRYDGNDWVRGEPPRLTTAASPQPMRFEDTASLPVGPSSVVYLHGHRFVGKGSVLRTCIKVPCQSVKVDSLEWKTAVLATAFIALAARGYARLYLGKRRGSLGMLKHKAVLVEPLARSASPSGLEGSILASLTGRPGPMSATDIVKGLRKEGTFNHVMKELIAQGYYVEGRGKLAQLFLGKKLVPDCTRILALQSEVQSVKNMIDPFKQANSEVYGQLMKDIRAAYA